MAALGGEVRLQVSVPCLGLIFSYWLIDEAKNLGIEFPSPSWSLGFYLLPTIFKTCETSCFRPLLGAYSFIRGRKLLNWKAVVCFRPLLVAYFLFRTSAAGMSHWSCVHFRPLLGAYFLIDKNG